METDDLTAGTPTYTYLLPQGLHTFSVINQLLSIPATLLV